MSLKNNYIDENLLKDLIKFSSDNEKLKFETEIIQLDFMSYLDNLMKLNNLSKTDLAKKMKKSSSFITQLFSGDKQLNLKHIALFQRIFGVKFEISEKVNLETLNIDFIENFEEDQPDYLNLQKRPKKYNFDNFIVENEEQSKLKIA